VKIKYVIDIVVTKNVKIIKVRTDEQLADFMTKQLAAPQFTKARDAIMVDYSKGSRGH
jgi:hypothetical protein